MKCRVSGVYTQNSRLNMKCLILKFAFNYLVIVQMIVPE